MSTHKLTHGPYPRVEMPDARRPAGYTRHVASLAGARFWRSQQRVPIASIDSRNACYFGYLNAWVLFENYKRVGVARTPVQAALFLVTGRRGMTQ